MEPVRILYVNGGPLNRGGIESYMMNYYRSFDRNKIQIDFVSIGLIRSEYDEEIELLGGNIYYIPKKSKNYFGYIRALRKIFKSNKYKIIHTHMDAMGMTVLKEAKKYNIPIRIAHSHNTQHLTNNFLKFLINEYARKNINKYATHMFACSEIAGRWLFGDKAFEDGKVTIIKNAIQVEDFIFDNIERNKLRKDFSILDNELVVGHVGRFDYQKNHEFILEVFAELLKLIPNSKLVLIGDGELREKIENKISMLNIKDNVLLLGVRNDVNKLYNLFDIFILPSIFEGLGIVAIEAQINGLQCILSDQVPREAKITEKVRFLSVDNSKSWAKMIYENLSKRDKRVIDKNEIKKLGYDINIESKKLERLYLDLFKEI